MRTPLRGLNRIALTALAVLLTPSPSRAMALGPDSALAAAPLSRAAVLRFATALAVAGDELLIGRPGRAARPGAPAGGVHLFRRTAAGTWAEAALLRPPMPAEEDEFGAALAIEATPRGGWLLAVGAPRARAGRGAVYLFERLARGPWRLRATLTAAVRTPGERFGAALALRGGVLLVGAPGAPGAPGVAGERGRVVVLRRGADTRQWREAATLVSGDTSDRRFGLVLALVEDRAFVAAPGPTYSSTVQGPWVSAVSVFRDSAGRWVPEARLADPDSASTVRWGHGYRFGAALLAEGPDLWIGSPGAPIDDSGAVLHYRHEAVGPWRLQDRLVPRTAQERQNFGAALARAGEDLVVGAPGTDKDLGVLYVFRPDTGGKGPWREVQQLGLADSATRYPRHGEDGPRLGEVLAGGAGVLLAGLPAVDDFEGAAVVFGLGSAGASTTSTSGGWQSQTLLVDTAWTTRRQPLTDVPCRQGRALLFDCRNVDLLAFLPLEALGGGRPKTRAMVNIVWGWSDSATGREFAVVGRADATAFVELTDPRHPVYLGELPRNEGTVLSSYREIKVYQQHAFIIGGGGSVDGGGMQVFDLTQLRAVRHPPVVFHETAHYNELSSTHTLAADEATGFLYGAGNYGAGNSRCGDGLHMIDVRTPTHPVFAGCTTAAGGHETHCALYRGPDARYRGRELCFNAAGGVRIVDVTDKQHTREISLGQYPNMAFSHQGWLSADQRYFFLGDEYDEFAMRRAELAKGGGLEKVRTRTIVFDLSDLEDPVVAAEFYGTTAATDHNLYVRGRYMFQANYKAGLRVIDVIDPTHPKEVGYFDTTPAEENTPDWGGTWTNYPYFRSGVVAVTSIDEGLFLLRFRGAASR